MPSLTAHERDFLLGLLEDGAATNTDLAQRLGISATAARKIRLKLERTGIIRGYRPILDMGVLGVRVISVLELRILPKGWAVEGGQGLQGHLQRHENVLQVIRLPDGLTTHLVVAGFRNPEEVDRFLHHLQSQFSELLEIRRAYSISARSLLKEDPRNLLAKVLIEGDEARLPQGLAGLAARAPAVEEDA